MTIDGLIILYTSCRVSLGLLIFCINHFLILHLYLRKVLRGKVYNWLSILPLFFFNRIVCFDTSMLLVHHPFVLFKIIIFLLNRPLLDDLSIIIIIDRPIFRIAKKADWCRMIIMILLQIKLRTFLLIIKASIIIIITIIVSFP